MAPSNHLKARLSGKGFSNGSAPFNGRIRDARERIIMKKRRKIVDARDEIVAKRRPIDARHRIEDIRKKALKTKQASSPALPKKKTIAPSKSHQVKKPKTSGGLSGRATFTSGRSTFTSGTLKRTIAQSPKGKPNQHKVPRDNKPKSNHTTNIQQNRRAPASKSSSSFRLHESSKKPLTKTIIQKETAAPNYDLPPRRTSYQDWARESVPVAPRHKHYLDYDLPDEPMRSYEDVVPMPRSRPIYRHDHYDILRPSSHYRARLSPARYTSLSYEEPRQQRYVLQDDRPSRVKMSPRPMDYPARTSETYRPYSSRYASSLIDDLSPPRVKSHGSSNRHILSRLDSSPACFRVMASNLAHSVEERDLQELFEILGPIVSCEFISKGVAEVNFAREEDAYKAVETYDRRQLDGQAMTVIFVGEKVNERVKTSSRRVLSPSMPSPRRPTRRTASKMSPDHELRPRPSRHDVAPDIGAIHHALFKDDRSSSGTFMKRPYL